MENSNEEPNPAQQGIDQMTEQVAAFQKIWMETFSKLVQTAATIPPDSAPPEILRQMRGGVFQGLAKSWDEFLRSPQFLEGMKQWTESMITMKKMSNEFMTRSHHEMQGTAREDVDTMMLAVRHMEKRLLDRLEHLETKLDELSKASPKATANGRAAQAAPKRAARPAKTRQTKKR